jgi:N utilization substance protein A
MSLIVNLGRTEGILPRGEQVAEEGYRIGDRIRCYLLDVRRVGSRVRILLSRTHPDFIRRLFELEVPEIGDRVIEIMAIAREPGYRTKVAVASADIKVDCVGACVGVRGSRIKAVIDELRGERIDIIKWSDSLETLIMNGLKPATIHLDNIYPDVDTHSAVVIVDEDQQSLAIGKKGQNVRLASRLCGWEIDIKTRSEFEADSTGEGESSGAPLPPDGDGTDGPAGDPSRGDASAADDAGSGNRSDKSDSAAGDEGEVQAASSEGGPAKARAQG